MVEGNDTKILMDAGVKLGKEDEYPLIPDRELKDIDAIVLSHAHLDHSGYLAHIYTTGYEGFTYCTKPTFELTNVLISDYIGISNPSNITKEGVERMQRHYKITEFNTDFNIKGLKLRLIPAGHILGSAMIEVSDGKNKLLYTGDVNFRTTKILDAAPMEHLKVDTLITESTYAGEKDEFPSEKATFDKMIAGINDTITRGGKVMVPSFAVGRAQEVLLLLDDYMKSGRLQQVPIYMDGMIGKSMKIHRHNVVYCRDELQKRILMNDDDPFKSVNFLPVKTRQDRAKVMSSTEACIIVSTSGMLSGGPILKYIEHLGKDEKNKLMMVGYQADGTLGRDMLNGNKRPRIGHKEVSIMMDVEMYHLSAHADRRQLLQFISKLKDLKNIFVVHGEEAKGAEFTATLKKDGYNAIQPELKQEITI